MREAVRDEEYLLNNMGYSRLANPELKPLLQGDRLPYEKDGLLDELKDDKNAGKNVRFWAG